MAASANVKHVPVRDLVVKKDGHIRPLTYYGGKGLDVRTVSGEFLLSLQKLWREQGDEILRRVAAQYPELIFISQVKLAKVMRVEIGSPDEFSKLGSKQAIWPAPGSADTELSVLMEPEVCHGETEVYTGVQA